MRSCALTFLLLSSILVCACKEKSCESMKPGLDRDHCLHDRLLTISASEWQKVRPTAEQIQDSIVRSAAIHGWVLANSGKCPREEALALCAMLQEPESNTCSKRLLAAHLNR